MKKMSRRKKRRLIKIISSSVFGLFVLAFLLIIIFQPSCKKDVDRTNGITADNFSLDIENESIVFDYVFNMDRAAVQREIDDITKLGICFHTTSGEVYREFTFEFVEGKVIYTLSVPDVFEEDYANIIRLDLYYIYKNDKGKDVRRFSEDDFEFCMYELAKNIEDDYAYNIVSIAENSIVRVDVEYDVDAQTISYNDQKGYTAVLLAENNGNLQIVFTTNGEKKFSNYARVYFNGKVTDNFTNDGDKIIYTTKISHVTNVDIELDKNNYIITSEENDLYKAYFGNLYGSNVYHIIVELKDNNVLSKNVEFKINGDIVDYNDLKPGFYYIEVQEDGINNFSIELDTKTLEYSKESDLYNVEIGRDERHEDIAVIISQVENNKLSKFSNVVVNGITYNLSSNKYEYKDGNIICYITDDRVSRVDVNLDTLKYTVSCDSDQYIVSMRDPDYVQIIIDVKLKYGFEYSIDVALFVNGIRADSETYIVEDNKIIFTIEDPNWSVPF